MEIIGETEMQIEQNEIVLVSNVMDWLILSVCKIISKKAVSQHKHMHPVTHKPVIYLLLLNDLYSFLPLQQFPIDVWKFEL